MPSYWIREFEVSDLWGRRDVSLTFDDRVNIIIGPNASGKTTLLNLLRYIITVDLEGLREIPFEEATLRLSAFAGRSRRTICVEKRRDGVTYRISKRSIDLDYDDRPAYRQLFTTTGALGRRRLRERRVSPDRSELTNVMKSLVSAAWLPVSRRLPIGPFLEHQGPDFGEAELESVDVRLRELLAELKAYRSALNAQLSERYSQFEKDVLATILYSKKYDRIEAISSVDRPTDADKGQLIRAFRAARLLDDDTKTRIDEHFEAANEALDRIAAGTEEEQATIELEDFLIIPLIGRTKTIVEFAREMETYREDLFRPVRRFEDILNSFLADKQVSISDAGQAEIRSRQADEEISPMLLSSGEKQLLILLIQALLWEDRPVVYVVDEPELSLHIEWQEKLLKGLVELGRSIQLIVATHAPEIVNGFKDRVIALSLK